MIDVDKSGELKRQNVAMLHVHLNQKYHMQD